MALFPLIWIFLTSVKPPTEVYTFPVKYLPSKFSLEGYRYLFSFANFDRYFVNSLLVSLIPASLSTILATMGGYVLTRSQFKLKHALLILFFFVQMLPTYLVMIPQFTMFSKMGLTNKLSGVMIIYTAFGTAFGTIMATAFFKRIPREMEEAALIDGCTPFGALLRVVIPIFLPSLGAIFSFSFVNSWNEIFTAVLFLHSDKKMTVPVALYSFVSKAGIQWNVMAAGIVVALIPTILVFAVAQRFIISGLTQGAVKE